jgi:hypothetical protein
MINSSCEIKNMGNKLVLRSIFIALMLLGQMVLGCRMSFAAGESSESAERAAPSSLSSKNGEAELLTLNHLRDSWLSLQQIKQQSINIYLEATRKDVQATDNTDLVYPKSISKKGLGEGHYLPPRMEWLYFYVGTMEPIIRLFADTVSDTKTGVTRLVVPKAALEPLAPLWKNWSSGIESLNEQVTAIYKLASEEKLDNIALGKHAVSMYKIAEKLEKTREKAVAIIRKTDKLGQGSETVGIH